MSITTADIRRGLIVLNESSRFLLEMYLGSTRIWPSNYEPDPEPTQPPEIQPEDTVAGDVLYASGGRLSFSDGSLETALYLQNKGFTPIGVVVVPGTHNVYGNGSCGIISLKPMKCNTPTTGGTSEQSMYWGVYGTDISTLPTLNQVPYIGTGSNVGDASSEVVGETVSPCLPSDKFSAVLCPHDTDTYYYSSSSSDYQAPSPYLTDGSRNPAYYQTDSPSSTSNAFADFDGRGNTDKIIAQRGDKDYTSWKPTYNTEADYPAASCCDMFYTDSTYQGDWYLPACGELGYIMPSFNKINKVINNIRNVYGDSVGVILDTSRYYWSSSEYSSYGARSVYTSMGLIVGSNKYNGNGVRAFLRIPNDSAHDPV